MKSEHIYNGEIPLIELNTFINPIKMTLDVDKTSYDKVFESGKKARENTNNYYNKFIEENIPGINEYDRKDIVDNLCTITYVPHTNGYDFRINPISFINSIFYHYNIDKKIDFINLDNASHRLFFKELVSNNIMDYILNNVEDEDYERNTRVLLDIDENISNITSLYDVDVNSVINTNMIPKNMLFYLAYKSLINYEHTKDEEYLVLPYEYYHNVYKNFSSTDEHNSSWPFKVQFSHRGRLWFNDFAEEYEELIGDKVVNDKDYRLDFNEIIMGCEILRPGLFTGYAKDIIRGGGRGPTTRDIDYDKYIDLLHRKINCYSSSGFDTFIKGSLGLDGYVGFKYKNEYLLFDQLYKTDKYGIKNLLIEPEAFYALPSDRLSLIRSPKPVIIEAKKKDPRIEKHNHREDSDSFERNVKRIVTGPNLSYSTFNDEIEKLRPKMLIKTR